MLRFAILALLGSNLIAAKPIDKSNKLGYNVTAPTRTWKLLQNSGGFDGRAGGAMYWNVITSKFVLHGVDVYDQDPAAEEEIFSGGTNGKFTQIRVTKPFNPLYSAISTIDINGFMYRIQGTDNAWNDYSDVWRSTDAGRSWVAQHENSKARNLLDGTRVLGAATVLVNDPSTLLIIGGLASANEYLDDIWKSTDGGMNWKMIASSNRYFGEIALNSALSTTLEFDDEVIDAVYQVGGTSGSDQFYNDVWVSTGGASNIGKTWMKVQKAPWAPRGAAYVGMTDTGIMIISGGVGSKSTVLNDIWASLDGGYAWGLCAQDAEYSDRVYAYTGMDADDYLYVAGGREIGGDRVSDIWKTAPSFADVAEVARACSLLVPSCGTGLRCLPSSPDFKSGMWGVTCDVCPDPPKPPTATE